MTKRVRRIVVENRRDDNNENSDRVDFGDELPEHDFGKLLTGTIGKLKEIPPENTPTNCTAATTWPSRGNPRNRNRG